MIKFHRSVLILWLGLVCTAHWSARAENEEKAGVFGRVAKKPTNSPDSESSQDARMIRFAKEDYFLKENVSAPGKSISELREFLRPGEEWKNYSKLVALRKMDLKTDADTLARATIESTLKSYPESMHQEFVMTPQRATLMLLIVSGQNVELSLWEYRQTKDGFFSVQFVLRNQGPYQTKTEFRAEQDQKFSLWQEELQRLIERAPALISASSR